MDATADWQKLTISLGEIDSPRVLSWWRWAFDRPAHPILLTRFGDWFLEGADGAVYRLDILEGVFERVSASREEFEKSKKHASKVTDWFQDGMVYAMYRAGASPQPGEGFGYAVPPILGGPFERENVRTVQMSSWQLFMAQVHEQIRALPPGVRVTRVEPVGDGRIRVHHDGE